MKSVVPAVGVRERNHLRWRGRLVLQWTRFLWLSPVKRRKFNERKSMTLRDSIFAIHFPFQLPPGLTMINESVAEHRFYFCPKTPTVISNETHFHLLLAMWKDFRLFIRMEIIVPLAFYCAPFAFLFPPKVIPGIAKEHSIKCHESFHFAKLNFMNVVILHEPSIIQCIQTLFQFVWG